MLEDFIFGPGQLNIGLASGFVYLCGYLFDLLLLLEVIFMASAHCKSYAKRHAETI